MSAFGFDLPTEVVFGEDTFDCLGEYSGNIGKRPFLVTGKHSARAAGYLGRALAQLPGAVLFDRVEENPTTTQCEEAAEICRARDCDHVIALGGGSPMDAAKAIAVLARNPAPASQYFGVERYTEAPLPLIAVPTTAGTGSEVTQYAVLVNVEERNKRTITGPALFPAVAILDPLLTLSLPRNVTIATGLDALSQAMEGIVSTHSTAASDVQALECCGLVRAWLPIAANEPGNREARARMLHAAMLSGAVIAQTGTTLVHGMGYYLTLEFGIAHGLANALLLAPVFRWNARHLPDRVAEIAAALGHPGPPIEPAAAENITVAVHTLLGKLGVSPAAKDHGAREDRLDWCAQHLSGDPSRFKRQAGTFATSDLHQLFQEAYEGR